MTSRYAHYDNVSGGFQVASVQSNEPPREAALGGRGACVPSHNLAITVPSAGLCTCWEDVNEGAHKLGSNRQERERKKEDEEEGEKGREKGGEKEE